MRVTLKFPFDNPVIEQFTVATSPGPRATLVEAQVTVNPKARDTDELRFTAPVNPLTLVRVIVEVAVEPWTTVREVGLIDMVKSPTLAVRTTVWTREPLVPVTVTV